MVERPPGHAGWSGSAQKAPSENPASRTPRARFARARWFSQAIIDTSSMSSVFEKCANRSPRSSSETSAGVDVIATARSSTRRSVVSKASLVLYRTSSASCRSDIPSSLPTAEPMSSQNGHPMRLDALIAASCL